MSVILPQYPDQLNSGYPMGRLVNEKYVFLKIILQLIDRIKIAIIFNSLNKKASI